MYKIIVGDKPADLEAKVNYFIQQNSESHVTFIGQPVMFGHYEFAQALEVYPNEY